MNTTIVSCGGKWTIPSVARLLKEFGIPFRVIHDLDAGHLSQEEIAALPAIHPFRANARIQSVTGNTSLVLVSTDNIEMMLGIPTTGKDKPYTAWTFVSELVEKNEVMTNQRLVEMVRFAFGQDVAATPNLPVPTPEVA